MDLNKEYHENLRIDGKPAVLNTVTNEIDSVTGETVITRVYVTSDLKVRKTVVERIPPAVKPAPAPVAMAKPETRKIPDPPTFPRAVPAKAKLGSLKGKALETGMKVVYETKTGMEAGVIVKVMFRTVCIDIDGTKDKSVKKSDILGLYLGA